MKNILGSKKVLTLAVLGALSLFLGTANPIIHIPFLVLVYPIALFLLAKEAQSVSKAFFYGWFCGFIGTSLGMYWLVVPVNVYGNFPLILSLPVPLLMGAVNAVFAGIMCAFFNKAKPMPESFQVFFAFLTWFFVEWFRSWILTGFTWMNISAALAAFPILVQGVSVLGMEGLSALYAFLAIALVNGKKSIQLGGIIGLVLVVGLGYARMQVELEKDNVSEATYLIIQGNISQELKWEPAMQEATLKKYLNLSEKGVNSRIQDEVDLILYPETALPFYLQNEHEFHKSLKQFAQKHQIPIITGGVTYKRSLGELQLYNSAFLLGASDKNSTINLSLGQVYSKQHLLPFGEYIPPFLDFKIFNFVFDGIGAFTPGKYQVPFDYKGNQLGMLICYEAIFSYIAQESVEKGAQILLNISNDAWYGRSSAAKQHLDLSILRAIEQNRYLIRSTNTGISAFVDPYGNIIESSKLFVDASLVQKVGYRDIKTIYHQISAYIPYIFNLLFLIFLSIIFYSTFSFLKKPLRRR